jgi:tRNA modification GTPase
MTSSDTIYALSTGIGRAGVAVFRASGPAARLGVEALAGTLPEPRRASLRRIRDPLTGEIIDEGLVLWLPGPASFTGEDMAEYHLHGSRAVADGMIGVLGRLPGYRLAEAGEFTRRALANGRTDLVAVEGLSDLLMATSAAQRRQALFHMEGDASRVFMEWRGDLVWCLARIEAAIDFSEEDQIGAMALTGVAERLDRLAGSLAAALASASAGESLREGFRVVIAGPPNVGKSSLLNRLAAREAAIVTDIPGTTRDPIDVMLDLAGLPVILTDTAGLRDSSVDPIERIGIDRTMARSREADMVIWLEAPDVETTSRPPRFDSEPLWVWNKVDLGPMPDGAPVGSMPVSAVTGVGIDRLVAALHRRLAGRLGDEPALITRARHRDAVAACHSEVVAAGAMMTSGILELAAEHLRQAARAVERLLGRIDSEAVLDVVFREFCVGK